MHIYVSRLQFSILISNQPASVQYEELTVLIKAENKQDAYAKANEIGRQNEDEFLNTNKHKVCWKFEGITHLEQVYDLENGSVLFSELKDDYSPEQLKSIQQRIRKMEENFIGAFLHNNSSLN